MRWLHLRLRAPLMSFGGEAIDAYGVIDAFPGKSMLTGLFANALGWTRGMREEHQELQERIVFGAVWEQEAIEVRDYQTARLRQDDAAWSTGGAPIGRKRSPSYRRGQLTAQRWRDYWADGSVSVVVALGPGEPTLDELAAALVRPARPLFLGRKHCLPSAPLLVGEFEALDVTRALSEVARAGMPATWPDDGQQPFVYVTDERNWISGLHGGARRVCRRCI